MVWVHVLVMYYILVYWHYIKSQTLKLSYESAESMNLIKPNQLFSTVPIIFTQYNNIILEKT